MTGFEPAASCSQSRRATSCATPGYSVFYPAGRILPNVAPYQLSYTRIFNFCHDTTAKGKNKVFSVCGHLCGQSRFCAVFGNRGKSSKRRCHNALRRFASPYPGYRHGTPKLISSQAVHAHSHKSVENRFAVAQTRIAGLLYVK